MKRVSRSWFPKTSTGVTGREREHRTILYCTMLIGPHAHSAVSRQLQHYIESVGAFLRQLQCIPLLGNLWSAAVQKPPLTRFCLSWYVFNTFDCSLDSWRRVSSTNHTTVMCEIAHSQKFKMFCAMSALRKKSVDFVALTKALFMLMHT